MEESDFALLNALQLDCKRGLKRLSRCLKIPMSTVYDKIKRFEKTGVVKGYSAILDGEKVGRPTTAFILVSIKYHYPDESKPLSQREIAAQVARLPLVQEVHVITGEWDILVKVKGKSMKEIGEFVIDRLRQIKGVDRTLTLDAFLPIKESSNIPLI